LRVLDLARLRDRRIPLAGQDVRQRDGAVEQVGPPRLAGALDRPGDVENVVEQLEGQADAPAEGAQLRRRPAALQRAQLAGGLEEPRGLELAAAQVALDADVRAPGVLALEQLAGRQGRRRAGQ